MAKLSAGLLLYRRTVGGGVEVLIAHMGGPFWAKKDRGAWSIPKGEYEQGDDPLGVALREFEEELGQRAPTGHRALLGEFKQRSGKVITVFVQEGDLDVQTVRSNEFELEWPKGSGQMQKFPEIDRAEWMLPPRAREKLLSGQVPAVDCLVQSLGLQGTDPAGESSQSALF